MGLKLNYRFGVPLKQQLAADEVAISNSLRGSRFDSPERDNLPVVEYRQRKNLTVYLATPPWDLQSGETVQLKLQIHSLHGIKALHWQGRHPGPQPDAAGRCQQPRWLEHHYAGVEQ